MAKAQLRTIFLTHPLIRDGRKRLGSLIHRDELIRLLLEAPASSVVPELARKALAEGLRANGIEDPAAALQGIREHALRLESSNPALGHAIRHDLAILEAAPSEFVAKINSWFDRTMDRVSTRFTFTTRRITLVNSVLIAVAIQMDTISIVNRLAANDSLRGSLVEKAYAQDKLNAMDPHQLTALASHDVFPVPETPHAWLNGWHLSNLPGFVISVLLLSLGAPFWFEALKDILKLRRVMKKE